MKSLKQYIVESVHTYNPVKIGEPTSTPIQKDPYGFPNLSNQSVTIIKAEFRYPATEPMIQQIAQLLGYQVDMVRVVSSDFDNSINSEAEGYANEMSHNPLLLHPELEEQPGAKEANKNYSDSYLSSIQKQAKDSKIDIPYAGTKTPDAFDPFKPYLDNDPRGIKSPMSTIKRPAKPATGASK